MCTRCCVRVVSQSAVQRIPLLKTRAGPRDEAWLTRLAEEYNALIKVSQRPSSPLATVAWHRRLTPCQCPPLRPSVFSASTSKTTKSPTRTGSKSSPTRPASSTHCPPAPPEPPDRLTSFRGPHATRWTGTCWHVHELLKYEFRLEFEVRPTLARPLSTPMLPRRRPLTPRPSASPTDPRSVPCSAARVEAPGTGRQDAQDVPVRFPPPLMLADFVRC